MNFFDDKTASASSGLNTPASPYFTPPAASAPDGSVSAFRPTSTDTSALRALQTIIEPGTVLDSLYQVGKLLGRGQVAAVYEGKQVETGEVVAIKILDARYSHDEAMVSRFLSEGRALASFNHPNIVKHIANGRDEDFAYIVMEFVTGITLEQLMHAITLEPHHYVHLAREISKGLTTVHAAGVVHGDLKPSNILVTRPGEVKITDFGAATPSNASRAGISKVSGTVPYMAPEVLDSARNVDYRADIYSLGITFYKVLTGKLPGETWTPPSELKPDLPPGIDATLKRAMDPDPEDRFITAKEFLDAVASQFDETARPPVPISPARGVEVSSAPGSAAAGDALSKKQVAQGGGVDWKMVLLCALAAVGLAATLIALAVFTGRWSVR